MKQIYSGNRYPNAEQKLLLQAALFSDISALKPGKNGNNKSILKK